MEFTHGCVPRIEGGSEQLECTNGLEICSCSCARYNKIDSSAGKNYQNEPANYISAQHSPALGKAAKAKGVSEPAKYHTTPAAEIETKLNKNKKALKIKINSSNAWWRVIGTRSPTQMASMAKGALGLRERFGQ